MTPIIRHSDFASFQYSIVILNTTTKTEIFDSRRIKVYELLKNQMTLEMPRAVASTNHSLMIYVFPNEQHVHLTKIPTEAELRKRSVISITGKVLSIAEIKDTGNSEYVISLLQLEAKSWKAFLDVFKNRQKAIFKLFKQIRE